MMGSSQWRVRRLTSTLTLARTEQTNIFSATLEGLTTTLDTARNVGAQAICQNKWRATYSTLLYKCATVSRLLFPDPYIPALNIQAHPLIILELTVNAALLSKHILWLYSSSLPTHNG